MIRYRSFGQISKSKQYCHVDTVEHLENWAIVFWNVSVNILLEIQNAFLNVLQTWQVCASSQVGNLSVVEEWKCGTVIWGCHNCFFAAEFQKFILYSALRAPLSTRIGAGLKHYYTCISVWTNIFSDLY